MGSNREAASRVTRAESDLKSAKIDAVHAKKVIEESKLHRQDNNFAYIIRESLLNGHSGT